jgi:hypothetical protein
MGQERVDSEDRAHHGLNRRAAIAGLGLTGAAAVSVLAGCGRNGEPSGTPSPEPGPGGYAPANWPDRTRLPIAPYQKVGKIDTTVAGSDPIEWPKGVTAPDGAPNVLLIMTDDVGFGASEVFGGPIPTPTYARLARNGLRYNRFHTTALCSPTRAALLTGRNDHVAATGIIMEFSTPFPGYHSIVSKSVVG